MDQRTRYVKDDQKHHQKGRDRGQRDLSGSRDRGEGRGHSDRYHGHSRKLIKDDPKNYQKGKDRGQRDLSGSRDRREGYSDVGYHGYSKESIEDDAYKEDYELREPSPETHEFSTGIYGVGETAHWSHMIHKKGAKEGTMYHLREDLDNINNPNLVYKREYPRDVYSKSLHGRVTHREYKGHDAERAGQILDEYGSDPSKFPEGNCQDWAVGGLVKLEDQGLLRPGTELFWGQQIAKPITEIERNVRSKGYGRWTDGPAKATGNRNAGHDGPADTRYEESPQRAPRNVGRIDQSKFANVFLPRGPRK
ncbi:hypothetical protein AA313_de0205178 [Arthrobotrys entomopaga]|nr:hypothetical protein AA313_de0205178 [Arthrobotrys entomopaga]